MCFSMEASFVAAAGLTPVGVYCVARAIRKNLRFLPLAITPIAFAVQQAQEGYVWYGLGRHDPLVHRQSDCNCAWPGR
jgi:hypothetical protein